MTSNVAVRAALVTAIVAAIVVVLGLFATWLRVVALVVMAAVSVATSPARLEHGGGWWWLMSAGVALSIAGAVIAQAADTLGGVLALVGAMMVVIFALVGYPRELED